jgi:hypothetical protein
MRVYVELPPGWGPSRVILTAWKRAGYHVNEIRSLGTGDARMIVRGSDDETPASGQRPSGTARAESTPGLPPGHTRR